MCRVHLPHEGLFFELSLEALSKAPAGLCGNFRSSTFCWPKLDPKNSLCCSLEETYRMALS